MLLTSNLLETGKDLRPRILTRMRELLCDGCGPVAKLEDEDDGQRVYYTRIALQLLDLQSHARTNHVERIRFVPTVSQFTRRPTSLVRLPATCGDACRHRTWLPTTWSAAT